MVVHTFRGKSGLVAIPTIPIIIAITKTEVVLCSTAAAWARVCKDVESILTILHAGQHSWTMINVVESLLGRGLGHWATEVILAYWAVLCWWCSYHCKSCTREDITKATMHGIYRSLYCRSIWFDYISCSFPKTKLLVVETGITEADLSIGSSHVVESVAIPSFRYPGMFVLWVMVERCRYSTASYKNFKRF